MGLSLQGKTGTVLLRFQWMLTGPILLEIPSQP